MALRRRARVLRLPTAGCDDIAALARVLDAGLVRPDSIVAIVGKSEGNGCVNGVTRGHAKLAPKLLLAQW